MDIKDAFAFHHINKNVYSGTINYKTQCVYCFNPYSESLLKDGSFRKCNKCKKHFKAQIIANPILNYNESTNQNK